MPKKKCAYSLKELSLLNITKSIDNYWCSHYLETSSSNGRSLLLLGPFDELAGCLVEELVSKLRTVKILKRYHLDLLLNSAVRSLNLSGWSGDLNSLPLTISVKCQKLSHLDISGCSNISKEAYLGLVRSLPNVSCLNLQYTSCTDTVLGCLGAYCLNLQELDISNCPVSDYGISSLCISMKDLDEKPKDPLKIYKLSVLETDVNDQGAACALKNLPYLTEFYFHNIFGALSLLHKEDLRLCKLNEVKKYLVTGATSHYLYTDVISNDSIKIALCICPNIKKISFVNVSTVDENLIECAGFPHLEEFQWVNGEAKASSFYGGFGTFLQIKGAQLVVLDLGELEVVDIPVIGHFCPNLRSLSLFLIEKFSHSSVSKVRKLEGEEPFQNLTSLSVITENGNSLPDASLRLLLAHASSLQSLKLCGDNNLSDDLLQSILLFNSFSMLMSAHFEHCSSISGQIFEWLLTTQNCLQSLVCLWCNNITRRDFERWQQYVYNENLDISLRWK